jgi:SAM-dependent methyltransferase
MVGDQGSSRRVPADLIHAAPDPPSAVPYGTVRTGYDAAADGWDVGPGPMYEPLARALVAAAPVPLAGRVVLDLGAGTGVAGRAALAAGAHRVVGADLSEAMLRHHALKDGSASCPVAADAVALPFRDDCFDLVLAAFCLNHLSRLEAGLAEMRRVAAAIAASTFAPGWTHPAKEAVDKTARSFGYRPPPWYTALAPGERAADPQLLATCAAAAGFTRVQTRTIAVPTSIVTPAKLAAWRLGMAHYAPFLHALDAPSQAAVRHAAEQAVAASGATGPLTVEMTVLTARRAAHHD